jgi:hypothetical protein
MVIPKYPIQLVGTQEHFCKILSDLISWVPDLGSKGVPNGDQDVLKGGGNAKI